jgi:hypothetical protein
MVRTFARTARQRMRLDSGGYRRDLMTKLLGKPGTAP